MEEDSGNDFAGRVAFDVALRFHDLVEELVLALAKFGKARWPLR